MAAQGGLMTYGSSVSAGMATVRVELFDRLCAHKHIVLLLSAVCRELQERVCAVLDKQHGFLS